MTVPYTPAFSSSRPNDDDDGEVEVHDLEGGDPDAVIEPDGEVEVGDSPPAAEDEVVTEESLNGFAGRLESAFQGIFPEEAIISTGEVTAAQYIQVLHTFLDAGMYVTNGDPTKQNTLIDHIRIVAFYFQFIGFPQYEISVLLDVMAAIVDGRNLDPVLQEAVLVNFCGTEANERMEDATALQREGLMSFCGLTREEKLRVALDLGLPHILDDDSEGAVETDRLFFKMFDREIGEWMTEEGLEEGRDFDAYADEQNLGDM